VGVLLIIGIVVAVAVLGAADWLLKVRVRLRRRQAMGERLAAAAARAEQQHDRHQQAQHASEALTSYMPAIQQPGRAAAGLHARPARKAGRDRAAPHHHDGRRRGSRPADGAGRNGEHSRRDGAAAPRRPYGRAS
jgi:type II secretory pathway pseudopilin PulG